jgi:hypothetical protein
VRGLRRSLKPPVGTAFTHGSIRRTVIYTSPTNRTRALFTVWTHEH